MEEVMQDDAVADRIDSLRLKQKLWERRFSTLACLASDAGVRNEDIEAVRKQL